MKGYRSWREQLGFSALTGTYSGMSVAEDSPSTKAIVTASWVRQRGRALKWIS